MKKEQLTKRFQGNQIFKLIFNTVSEATLGNLSLAV